MLKSEMTTDNWENRMDDDFITISKKDYKNLQEDSHFLFCLRSFGVDNWEGYDLVCNMYWEGKDESESKQGDLFPEEQ